MRFDFNDWKLQLFADGGDGAGAAPGDAGAAEDSSGVMAPAAGAATVKRGSTGKNRREPLNVDYGIDTSAAQTQKNEPAPEPAKEETFEDLIKGRFKEDYDKRVQDTISKRFKSAKADKEKLEALSPVLDMLAQRYELKPEDLEGEGLKRLIEAVQEDDSYYEQEAAERGLSIKSLKQMKRLERENAAAKKAEETRRAEAQNRAAFEKLYQQAEAAKQFYPGFDLQAEMQNPAFVRLTANNVDAKTAYEVIHKDDILRSGMAYAAQTAAQKVSNAIQSNAARPTENGLATNAPARVRVSDPRLLTKEQRRDLRQRVIRGEKVTW